MTKDESAMHSHTSNAAGEIRSMLQSKGLRVTSVRMAVIRVLIHRGRPMTHEQVMGSLSEGDFDRASVWRILSDLTDHQLLRRMDLGDRVWRFELADNCGPVDANHAHFMCNDCGDVNCLPDLIIQTPSGALPEVLKSASYNIRLDGSCGNCESS